MIDIGSMVSGLGLAQSVAELMGLVETLEKKIDKLTQSELAAGLRNLEQACLSKVEAESLLREARSCFNKALGLESGYRRGVAYLGLALCHAYLHDRENCIYVLRELLRQTPIPSITSEYLAKARAESKKESSSRQWFTEVAQQLFIEVALVAQLSRLAAVVARRANFTPASIRRFVQPTRDEMILGIRFDSDAANLAKLQILVAAHLGEAVGWMERYELNPEDLPL